MYLQALIPTKYDKDRQGKTLKKYIAALVDISRNYFATPKLKKLGQFVDIHCSQVLKFLSKLMKLVAL